MTRRVLMTIDAVGGVWTYAMELCRGLGDSDVEVVLAALGPAPSAAQRRTAESLANVRLLHRPYRLEWDDPGLDVARAGEWLLELEHTWKPDICHFNGYFHASLPFAAPKLIVAHSCVVSWWNAVRAAPLPSSWQEYRRKVSAGLRAADAVVAPSQWMLDRVREIYSPRLVGRVIANTRNPSALRPAAKEDMVFAAGRVWDPAKNFAVLSACAPGLPWPVYVAGPRLWSSKGVDLAHCHALGELDAADVATWLGRASIYALPAKYEPFGLSALEAALAGCALVLGDIPSLREVWGDAAVFVDPNDAEAWGRALLALSVDPARRGQAALAARTRAQTYSPVDHWRAYVNLYGELTAARRRLSCVS